MPVDAATDISLTVSDAPSFFSLSGNNGVLSSTALPGNYIFTIEANDSISGLGVTINVNL